MMITPNQQFLHHGPTVEEEPQVNLVIPTNLSGMVFEDCEKVDKQSDGSMDGTNYLTNNYKYDEGEPTVEGVRVSITGTNNTEILTSKNGKYSYNQPGQYKVKFIYDRETNENNYSLNKDTLKYNGQDYSMVTLKQGTSGYELNYLRKIKEMEKSFTEIYILIDYSVSMRELLDGDTSRVEVVKESAINFVNELFEEAEGNIAVGFIAFAYDPVIVKKPTNVKADIIDGIKKFTVELGLGKYNGKLASGFTSLNHRVGTNIGAAVLKGKDNYLSDESNKVMILFSDGAATAHKNVESLYGSDFRDEEIVRQKLTAVAENTKLDLQSVIDSNITLINILNKTYDEEKEFVEKSFKNDGSWIGNFYEVDYLNRDAVEDTLLKDTCRIIEETETEYSNLIDNKEFHGDDDDERRKKVNENYEKIYYGKLKLFDVINKLKGNAVNDNEVVSKWIKNDKVYSEIEMKQNYKDFINSNDVRKFINNSWMQTKENDVTLYGIHVNSSNKVDYITDGVNKVYEFSYYKGEEDDIDYCYVTDNNGTGLSGEYKEANVHITETGITLDGALIIRDEFKLVLEKKITGVRLTLNDGTVLYNMISENADQTLNKNKEFKELYCKELQKKANLIDDINMKIKNLKIDEVANFPESVWLILDTDLLQGATLEVEYTMIIKNNSGNSTFSREISIVDYFDNGLMYDDNTKLMTEEGKNSDYGWSVLTKDELDKNEYISKNTKEYGDNFGLYVNYNEKTYKQMENIPENGDITNYETNSKYINPVIGNNGERYIKVVLSKVLSGELDDFSYKNQAEILKYSNNNSRRINYTQVNKTGTTRKYATAGNYVPTGVLDKFSSDFTNVGEIDTAVANPIKVIPPTGLSSKTINNRIYFIASIVFIISLCMITIIRKIFRK